MTLLDMKHHANSAPNEEFVVKESMLRVVLDHIQIKYSMYLKICYLVPNIMKGMFVIIGESKKSIANIFVDVRLSRNVDAYFVLMLRG